MNMYETCRQVEKLLFAYVDGALPEADRAFVEKHLEACLPCMGRASWERLAKALVHDRKKDAAAMPESLRRRVLDSLEAAGESFETPPVRAEGRPRSFFPLKPALALAASLVLAVAAYIVVRQVLPPPILPQGEDSRGEKIAEAQAASHR